MAEWQRGWRGANYGHNFGHLPTYSAPHYSDYYHEVQLSPRPVKKSPFKRIEPGKVHKMIASTVHWCEYGGQENGHAFSSKDPGKERIVRSKETGKRDGYGNQIVEDEEFYLCGKHSNGLFRDAAEKAPKEIKGTTVDPENTF